MTRDETRPGDAEFDGLIDSAHRSIHREMGRRRRGLRRAMIGGAFGVVVVGAGAAVAASTGLLGGIDATHTRTADFDLGAAPEGATFVHVTVDVTCQPDARYEIDLDHASDPTSLHCGKGDAGEPSHLAHEMKLLDDGPKHTMTVTTNVEREYTVRAHYRSGLTSNEKHEAERQRQEEQRAVNARSVKRTDKVPSTDPLNHPALWPDPYYVNENGMTIGTFDRGTTPYDQWPDLEPSVGPGGERGFLLTEDGAAVSNPTEAVAYMKRLRESGRLGKGNTLYTVLFAEDGKTVIARYDGDKKIGNPSPAAVD